MTVYITNFKVGSPRDLSEIVEDLRQYGEVGSFNFSSGLGSYEFDVPGDGDGSDGDLWDAALFIRDIEEEINANYGFDSIHIYKAIEKESLGAL